MRKVIINADDFGMSEAFNYGVIKSYCEGVVSSTSLMVNLPAAEHAVKLAKDYPNLFIGQHTNLVLGEPCSDPASIPSLVDSNGHFLGSKDYKTGKRKFVYEDVKKETIAQMERFRELTGYDPKHIEGHSAGDENVGQAFYDIAREYNVHASMWMGADLPPLDGYLEAVMPTDDTIFKAINSGVKVEHFLNDDFGILKQDEDKVVELHFHPGYLDQFILDHSTLTTPRCLDLATLCDERVSNWLEENEIELISFGDLALEQIF